MAPFVPTLLLSCSGSVLQLTAEQPRRQVQNLPISDSLHTMREEQARANAAVATRDCVLYSITEVTKIIFGDIVLIVRKHAAEFFNYFRTGKLQTHR